MDDKYIPVMLTAVETLAKEVHAMEQYLKSGNQIPIPRDVIAALGKKLEAFKLAHTFLKELGYD